MNAIVYPIISGDDWCEPAPPIMIDRASKAAAIRALRERGYRIMWRGGLHEKNIFTAEDLRRSSGGGNAAVMEAERRIGYALPDEAEIDAFVISVWPERQ